MAPKGYKAPIPCPRSLDEELNALKPCVYTSLQPSLNALTSSDRRDEVVSAAKSSLSNQILFVNHTPLEKQDKKHFAKGVRRPEQNGADAGQHQKDDSKHIALT